ncbi:MAG: FtsX-like permease family protein [Chloroflexota bacterium]
MRPDPGGQTWLYGLPFPLRSVLRRWRGTVGMMIGVGIALGIGMMFLGVNKATVDLFAGDFSRSGVDVYAIQEGGKLVPLLPGESPGQISHARGRLSQIRSLPGVTRAIGVQTWTLERERQGPKRRGDPVELLVAVGVDGDPTEVPDLALLTEGRWIARSDEVVLGSRLAIEKQLGVGSSVRLSGRDFTVVGIGRLRGVGFAGSSYAYMDLQALRQRADLADIMTIIMVDASDASTVRARIDGIESLTAYDVAAALAEADAALASDRVGHWIILTLVLSIAALFVGSMLARSVSERRLDFATLRAIGIPSRTILLAVAGEALLVSVVAGFLGMAVAEGFGVFLNRVMAVQFGVDYFYVADAELIASMFGLAIGLGALAGLAPARRATQVDPVEILREA